jgi:hypothetical protein
MRGRRGSAHNYVESHIMILVLELAKILPSNRL